MPTDKDFKRLVRGRMQKTGESYTAARAQLRKQKPVTSAAPRPAQYAAIAGKSDAIIKERTGCTWERWVKALDRAKAEGRDEALREDIAMRKAVDLLVESAKPIPVEQAAAREKLWTPDKEGKEESGSQQIWTPGS